MTLIRWSIPILVLLTSVAADGATSRYAAWQGRPIKALSAEQVAGYLDGRGMALALPAELNGYPGPRHVLDLAQPLGLSERQRRQTQALFAEMRAGAIALGRQILAGEADLERLFAEGAPTDADITRLSVELGRLQGALRAHHLTYHRAMRALLRAEQIAHYQRLRGYGRGHGHAGHGTASPGEH